jgi:TetR/AcrR family transcriptional repressor of nem operon
MTAIALNKRRRGRPPKGLSDPNETRATLLRSGVEVLTEKGFAATGIDEILRRAGVPKGSFYHYFSSKQDFGEALVAEYDRYFSNKLDRFLLDDSRPPLQRIEAFIEDAAQGMARYAFSRGCLVGNLGQEMGALPEPFRNRISEVFANWQARLASCLELAREQRQIPSSANCAELSQVFWIGWEGAVLRAKLERSDTPLYSFGRYFLRSIQTHTTNQP